MKIIWTIVKIALAMITLTLIILDLLKVIPVEWERLVSIGGLLSAFSVPVVGILEKFGFDNRNKSGKDGNMGIKPEFHSSSEKTSDTNKSRSDKLQDPSE